LTAASAELGNDDVAAAPNLVASVEGGVLGDIDLEVFTGEDGVVLGSCGVLEVVRLALNFRFDLVEAVFHGANPGLQAFDILLGDFTLFWRAADCEG
jgi:hypothetical protein